MTVCFSLPATLAVLVTITLASSAAQATGWNDFHVKLDDRHGLFKGNTTEITITRSTPGRSSDIILVDGHRYGPLRWAYRTSGCYLVLHGVRHGELPEQRDVSSAIYQRFVIHRESGAVLGPLDHIDFFARARDCGAPSIVAWMSVREAYRYSFRTFPEQRFEHSNIRNSLFRAFLRAIVTTVVLFPVGVISAGLLYAVRRVRRRPGLVFRYAFGIWLVPPLLVANWTAFNGVFVLW